MDKQTGQPKDRAQRGATQGGPASTHSARRTPGRRGQAGGGAFATKETDKRENKTENVPLAEQPEPPEQQAGWGSARPPPALGGALVGGVTHPGAAERAGGQARGGTTDGPGPGNTGAQGGSDGALPAPPPSGGPAESPVVAPAQRRPGSAQGGPAVSPALHQTQEGPGPWGSWEPHGAASGLGAPLPPTQKLPHIRGPKPQAQRAERGPQHSSRA